MMVSCKTAGTLAVTGVAYQSVTTTCPDIQTSKFVLPVDARILATFAIDQEGRLAIVINNLTDEIMTIDQEASFLIDSDGKSISYYDPNVYANTDTQFASETESTSLNLGSLANAFGVGGRLGTLLGGITTSSSSTYGRSTSNTVILKDQERIKLGPHGSGVLSKTYYVTGLGRKYCSKLSLLGDTNGQHLSYENSPVRFKVCISYMLDSDAEFNKFVTDFYVDAQCYAPVSSGRVNAGIRKVIETKPDLFGEPWYLMSINNNIQDESKNSFYGIIEDAAAKRFDYIVNGLLFNYE